MTEATYNLLENAVQNQLSEIDQYDVESKEGKEALAKAVNLVDLLITVDKSEADSYDKQERRRIEEERNKASDLTERKKQELTWGRAALEMGKVIVPAVLSIIAYNVFQRRVLDFEEHGRITSTAGRDLHLPKFMK